MTQEEKLKNMMILKARTGFRGPTEMEEYFEVNGREHIGLTVQLIAHKSVVIGNVEFRFMTRTGTTIKEKYKIDRQFITLQLELGFVAVALDALFQTKSEVKTYLSYVIFMYIRQENENIVLHGSKRCHSVLPWIKRVENYVPISLFGSKCIIFRSS